MEAEGGRGRPHGEKGKSWLREVSQVEELPEECPETLGMVTLATQAFPR